MKPAHVWALFAVCLSVVLIAMAWSSATVLRLESAEIVARSQAALEENARLALWRMDSALTPLLAQESARPYFQYGAFYPAASAYSRMFAEAAGGGALVASPLLRETPAQVLLHFQVAPRGDVSSPQVPAAVWAGRALSERHVTQAQLAERAELLGQLRGVVSAVNLAALLPREPPRKNVPAPRVAVPAAPEALPSQKLKSAKEFEARQQTMQTNALLLPAQARAPVPGVALAEVVEGAMTPLWVEEALLLARRVRVDTSIYVQGCWLAWPRLQRELVSSVQDLLPNARLERVDGAMSGDDERRLAALPVRLIPGGLPEASAGGLSPTRLSLIGAWACVLLAAASVAALLKGVLNLSERRRVFVSAVTHELRTPLTSFRLYTDMLAEGMVPEGAKRQEYLERMRSEAERLGHLVENVLFYSRVESGRAGATREDVSLPELLEQTSARLKERARAAGLQLVLERDPEPVRARVDRSALEQVLANLVDNACKYAAPSTPPILHLELLRREGRALIRVRDHGPGLSDADRRRLFRAFSKSDREAAGGVPGVGLGLALSRRLMRAQGGDLGFDRATAAGATFVITLPLAE